MAGTMAFLAFLVAGTQRECSFEMASVSTQVCDAVTSALPTVVVDPSKPACQVDSR